MSKLLVLHGPNLNLLGSREQKYYGDITLCDLNKKLQKKAKEFGVELLVYQSNAEHELIAMIHKAYERNVQYIIFNPAAFTHTSIALRDALLSVSIPFIEVHLSNIFKREKFRHHSFFSDIAEGVISGFGANGYTVALNLAIENVN